MKKILVILLVLMLSNTVSSSTIAEKWARKKEEQKHRFSYQLREVRQQGRVQVLRAKQWRKANRYYRCNCYRSTYRIYSMRACPL